MGTLTHESSTEVLGTLAEEYLGRKSKYSTLTLYSWLFRVPSTRTLPEEYLGKIEYSTLTLYSWLFRVLGTRTLPEEYLGKN